MRRLVPLAAATAVLLVTAGPTPACGGLIGPNGAVNLLRTTTFAGYHDGVEHYVTAFAFAGGEGEFGSLFRCPTCPPRSNGAATGPCSASSSRPNHSCSWPRSRARGARRARPGAARGPHRRPGHHDPARRRTRGRRLGHGPRFRLPPDAPEVLDFYANRSPIFLAAVFDADAAAARGQAVGDGTPVHLTIPTDDPWVPLRILALGKSEAETVEADLYLLTDKRPALLPAPGSLMAADGMELAHSGRASDSLLTDLRRHGHGMGAEDAWLTKVRINAAAPDVSFDLAIDAGGGLLTRRCGHQGGRSDRSAVGRFARVGAPGLAIGLPLAFAWFAATIVGRRATPPPAGA